MWYRIKGARKMSEKTGYRRMLGINLSMTGLGLYLLLSSTSIVKSECTPTPDCASIGYSETSCEGDFVRCPFDISKLLCLPCDNDYKYDCSGDNISGGSGIACGGKYTSCECSGNYTWNGSDCVIVCSDEYKYTCTREHETVSPSASECGGYYNKCGCDVWYSWFGGECISNSE